jgi:crotonobetainyl-CoA:carnitine CoA-transferase CaiB-like acyl-CoA transferase
MQPRATPAADPSSPEPARRPLEGIVVLEAGRMAAGPACATMLADLGASVVKVEPVAGDPARGPGRLSAGGERSSNPRFELHNRGRRSLAVDLTTDRGHAVFMQLVDRSDVFVTNMRPSVLKRLGIDWEAAHRRNERLVYGQINGYGLDPRASNWPSYDHGAFWSYVGTAMSFAGPDGEPPQPSGGLGDRAAAVALAAGIAVALFERERTGTGRLVSTSLVAAAMWLMGSDVSDALATGHVVRSPTREHAQYPTLNCYRAGDGRWFWLQMMLPERQWVQLLAALNASWLDDDERFRGGSQSRLGAAASELIAILDGIFVRHDLRYWESKFRQHGIWYAPVQTIEEAIVDPVVQDSGAFVDSPTAAGRERVVASPVAFDGHPFDGTGASPGAGEHTVEILGELGMSAEIIAALRADGIVAAPAPELERRIR